MSTLKLALMTTAAIASAAQARDLGNGFSLTGEVELEYISSDLQSEPLSFADLTLGWRSQGGGAVGFGFDLAFVDLRAIDEGDHFNDLWGAVVLTTSFGELAVGKPRPVLDRMFIVPDIGGTRYFDLTAGSLGGIDGSLLALITMFDNVSSYGATFQGSTGGLGYGLGVHRFEDGGSSVDGFEIGGSYMIGQTEIFAGYESLDIPGLKYDRTRLGLHYAADRWSVGAHASRFAAGPMELTSTVLFGDYQATEALKLGAQYLNLAIGSDDIDFYGVSAEYGFGGGGFAQLGVIHSPEDGGDELYSASIGFRF